MVVQNSQINRGHFCKNGHKNDCAALACIPDTRVNPDATFQDLYDTWKGYSMESVIARKEG